MRAWLISTTTTLMCGHLYAIIAIVGPPTYPAPMQQMEVILVIVTVGW